MSDDTRRIPISEDGELLVHEDKIKPAAGLLEAGMKRHGEMGQFDSDNDEDLEAWLAAQEAAKVLKDYTADINPARVALAGVVFLMFIGVIASGWYWVLPRDAVELETRYMQRGGHLMMSELSNSGSRDITDVLIEVEFQSIDGVVLDSMSVELDIVYSHSTVAGDDLELLVEGYSVWDDYIVRTHLQWTDYNGVEHAETWAHPVGKWSSEIFIDEGETTTWPM